MNRSESVTVGVSADTSQFDVAMEALTSSTKNFGEVFTSTISNSIKSGKGFEDTLRSIGSRMADLALNQAIKPIENLFSNVVGSIAGGLSSGVGVSATGYANGGVFANSKAIPFARGGVVTAPTAFGFSNQLGVMGEAGPEAVMPLQRGPDGKLGVASSGGGASQSIVFNVQASDAASFRKSEAQITALLARAVARGQRGL